MNTLCDCPCPDCPDCTFAYEDGNGGAVYFNSDGSGGGIGGEENGNSTGAINTLCDGTALPGGGGLGYMDAQYSADVAVHREGSILTDFGIQYDACVNEGNLPTHRWYSVVMALAEATTQQEYDLILGMWELINEDV